MEVRFIKDWFNPSTNKWIEAGRMVHIGANRRRILC